MNNLFPCPACGSEASHEDSESFVECQNPKCWVSGPMNDPNGSKWNAMVTGCAKAPAGMGDAELIARAIRAHAAAVSDLSVSDSFDDVDAELARREKERQT